MPTKNEGNALIDIDGYLRCDGFLPDGRPCRKKLAAGLKGEVKIVCHRCKTHNAFETAHTASFNVIKLLVKSVL